MGRGPSAAVVKAVAYLKSKPGTKAPELAKKFGLNESTIYRAAWYKEHQVAQPQGENK